METILKEIQDCFLNKEKYFIVFAEADTRIEGWFKAELIFLLNELKNQKRVEKFEREAKNQSPTGNKKIDFHLWLNGKKHLCELKALCIPSGWYSKKLAFLLSRRRCRNNQRFQKIRFFT